MKNILFVFIALIAACSATAQQWGLYTLYAPTNGTQTYLIDTAGTTYKTWSHSSSKKTGFSVYLAQGDTLVRTVAYSSNQLSGVAALTGEIQKVLWNGTIVWDYVHSSSTYCLHHDICPMPNGNVLMIAYETKTGAEAVQAGCSSSTVIWPEKIIEVKPTGATTGTIVWEWHLWDHLCQTHDATKDNYVSSIIDNPQLMNINYNPTKDWWHMNGIDYNPTLDQIAVTSRAMNEFFIIDHSTTTAEAAGHTGGNGGRGGDFLYRWGNPESYGATGTANYDVVHYPTWIGSDNPNYPNHICTFNNNGGAGGKSCVDVILPPYNGYNYSYTPGQVIPPSTYAYRHTSTYNTPMNGSAQALPNGNFMNLICSSNYLYEINSSGTTLWSKTVSGQPSNAVRYSKCYVRGLTASASASSTIVSAGSPVDLYSSVISPTEASPTYTYVWSSGDNTQNATVYPAGNTTYIVTITNTAIGCSDTASVTIQVTTGFSNADYSNPYTIYPNPTTGILNIGEEIPEKDFTVTLTNQLGKILLKEKNSKSLNLSSLNDGIYFLSVQTEMKTYKTYKVILAK
ncbi:MAG: aryl-sulfate sulfotransferase [Bacteroidota bacterium]